MTPLSTITPALSADQQAALLEQVRAHAEAGPIPADELEHLTLGASQKSSAPTGSFSGMLGQLVQDVNAKQKNAGDLVNGVLSGADVPLHQVKIALEESGISFQLMVEVRNKLLEAYQELMRLSV